MPRPFHFPSSAGPIKCLRAIALLASLALAVSPAFARPREKTKAPAPPPSLLPATFSAWQLTGAPTLTTNPAAADTGNAAVLQECGFVRYEKANYLRDDGALEVQAMQFGDASGAYSAFTFYRRPGMLPEQIGAGAAFDGTHVLFWEGNVLVDASFQHLTAMSASELRSLAQLLPLPRGNSGVRPTLDNYLPPQHMDPMSLRYSLGPQTYALGGGVLPPSLVDFARGAEAVTAQYNTPDGVGTLTLLEYPTPQIAMDREQAIAAYLKTGNGPQNSFSQALGDSSPSALLVRRSGPIVALTSGNFSSAGAHALLARLHYEADITWDHPEGYVNETTKLGRLILGIFSLVGILIASSVVLGFFFGGGRAMVRKLQGKPASALDETAEIITLGLSSTRTPGSTGTLP